MKGSMSAVNSLPGAFQPGCGKRETTGPNAPGDFPSIGPQHFRGIE